jgi:hypothetical protein
VLAPDQPQRLIAQGRADEYPYPVWDRSGRSCIAVRWGDVRQ